MNIFLSLNSTDVLIEYVYHNGTSPEIINTDDAGFYLLENNHLGTKQLMNSDGVESLTNNTRNRNAVQIEANSKKFALLTTNKLGSAYNDFDEFLTSTQDLPLVFNNPEGVVYDTVKVHFIQGFTFNDFTSGYNLEIFVKDKTGTKINLLNSVYKKGDSFAKLNPNPFLYQGRQYSTFLEYKIPSLKFLIDSYLTDYVQGNNSDILSYKISNGNGFNKTSLIELTAGFFGDFTNINNQYYSTRVLSESTSISQKDDFENVGVSIKESTNGDFIEFYGTYNNEIFSDYMQSLNNSGLGEHIAIHKLTVTEQLPNTTSEYRLVGQYNPLTNTPNLTNNSFLSKFTVGSYWVATETGFSYDIEQNVNKGDLLVYNPNLPSVVKVLVVNSNDIETYSDISQFIKTSELEFLQDGSYSEPNTFRPVLKFGGSALSYKIDYLLKIFNVNTSSTIEKRGSFVSFTPNKYGKELLKINTKDNIQIFDVFNKKVINTLQNTNNIVTPGTSIQNSPLYSKNITSFKQVNSVFSGVSNVRLDKDGNITQNSENADTTKLKGQGSAVVYISPFDTFLQFNIYEQTEKGNFRSLDLSKIGDLYLNFLNKNSEILKVNATKNQNIDESKGQILFRITPELYNLIINSSNDVFFITSKSGTNSPESVLYSGKYAEYSKISEDETNSLINQQNQTISDLNEQVKILQERLKDIQIESKKSQTNSDTVVNNALNIKNSPYNPFGATAFAGSTGKRI